ncbi:MAG: V-type ATP synthase subunit A, partial [Thermoplasmata archaeon]
DVVFVGNSRLMGEVIKIVGEYSVIQVYEDTSGVKPGEMVENTGHPLVVELGPGLLTSIYDGIQRPLTVLREKMGDFIDRGITLPGLDHTTKWDFKVATGISVGMHVKEGTMIGTVQETRSIVHRICVPPGINGRIRTIRDGSFTIDEPICVLEDGRTITMCQRWPVREPRPFTKKLMPEIPLKTGQRILDCLFPVAKGGTAAIPGPFGSGKTVTQQALAKWSDADIVVYIGCGERGNEMTEVLTEFPHLIDPKTGNPLMDRTVLIANTSNMPVAAREASVYTGITIAEYYRDMGYDVSLMADSTSRWAEAMREISSRLEEMPGEEGYPAYLSAKLASFYERAGRVITLGEKEGSITVIGAVSPPGGDFSEPVTQNTLRIVKVFWALDAKLAHRRHFPAINWLNSYTLYSGILADWYKQNVSPEWNQLKEKTMEILQTEAELQEIVQLVGSDALKDKQVLLDVARLIREVFLQQNAFHEVDTYCPLEKQFDMLKAIHTYYNHALAALSIDIPAFKIIGIQSKSELAKVRFEKDYKPKLKDILSRMEHEFAQIRKS